jgi:hypothetical protein
MCIIDDVPSVPIIRSFLGRVRLAVRESRVTVTAYARGGAHDLNWEEWDIIQQLLELTVEDWLRCEDPNQASAPTSDLVWVFTPPLPEDEESALWIRLVERDGIVVISLHIGE